MAKKGNMNIDKNDFDFDDEMFPLDDSVYDDDDDLAGFSFDPNSEGPTGVKGFFVNTMKSIKGVGLDFVDEFLPEVTSLTDDVKMALSDSKDQFVENKDKAIAALADLKSSFGSKINKESAEGAKKGFKNVMDNIKKGKFYTSNRDKPIDMDSFLNDDEDEETEEYQEEQDTSGIMTTKFNYKMPRKRVVNNIVVNNGNDNGQMYADIQEAATATISSTNMRIAKAQISNTNQNFYESLNILKSIDDNLYGLSKFLTHYGKTNIDAQLEFDSKTLAFLTDQRALLKDILKTNRLSVGIKEKDETEEDNEENKSLFSFGGSIDFGKYGNLIKENAKNMFMGTQLGQVIDMGSGMAGMLGKDSGIKLNPADLASNLLKSFAFNQLIGSKTKTKLDRLNDLYGNIGGALTATANRWKDSDNGVLSFLGELMGTEKGINKHIDLSTQNLQEQTVFDVMTKESINETIPNYLAQILSAITGNKLTYYNHEDHRFEERDSIEKKYKQVQEDAINSNIKFTSAIDDITDNVRKKNRKFTQSEINKAIDKFKDNLIESKTALDPYKLNNREDTYNQEYVDKIFRGFESITSEEKVDSLKNLISAQIIKLKPEEIADLNSSITKVANDVELSSKQFKEQMAKTGGLTAIAELNDKERWEENEYNKKYSSLYNEKLVKDNIFAKNRAKMNLLQLQKSEFGERVGKINLNEYQKNEMSSTATSKVNEIYELLLNGIKVYPSYDDEGITNISKFSSESIAKKKAKEDKEREELENEDILKALSSDARIKEDRARKINEQQLRIKANDNSLMSAIREGIGMDRAVDRLINVLEAPLSAILGKDAVKNLVNDGAYDNELLSEAKVAYEQGEKEKAERKAKKEEEKKAAKAERKANGKETYFDKLQDGFSKIGKNIKDFTNEKAENLKQRNRKKAYERALKEEKNAKEKENRGSFARQIALSTGGDDFLIKMHNTLLESNGTRRTKVFVDPDWLSSLKEDSSIKNGFYNAAMNHGALITTDPYDDDIYVAFYKSSNLSEEEKKYLKDKGVTQLDAIGKNIPSLNKILMGYNPKKSLEISRNAEIMRNNSISNYDDRDKDLNKAAIKKFDFNAKNENVLENHSLDYDVDKAKNKYNEYNKKYNKESDKYKKLSDEKKKKIEEEREKLLKNVNDTIAKRDSEQHKDLGFKYKYINKINSSKDAGIMFLKPGTQKEIDELLYSNDEEAIYQFANKIKSSKEKMFIDNGQGAINNKKYNELIENLDPKFKSRVMSFMNDPELMGHGIRIKETVRSPLLQFALYSKGRVKPEITKTLMESAGYKSGKNGKGGNGLSYFPEEIRNLMGPDGITVRSLASNHLTGRSFDLKNDGSLGYKKIAAIASKYGIKWAGDKDKPHFEFDENWKKNGENKQLTPKSFGTEYKPELKVSGKSLSYYQNDPIDTVVTGKPVEVSKQFKTNRDILEAIYGNTERIANNIETVGFRFGIPGIKGKGLIGKVGDTAKSLGSKLIDGTKFVTGKAFEIGSSLISTGVDIAKKGFDGASDLFSKGKEKILNFKDEKYKKLVGKATNFLLENKFITKKELKKLDESEILKTAMKFGFNASSIGSFINKGVSEAKDIGGNLYNKAKDFILGKKEDSIEKAKDYLLDNKIATKRKLNKMTDSEIIKLAIENGFKESKERVGGVLSGITNTITKGVSEAKDIGGNLYNKAKDFILGKKESSYEKAKEFLLNAKIITQKELDKLPEKEVIALALKNGFEESKGRVGGLLSTVSNIGYKIINRGTNGEGSLISIGGGVKKTGKILSKMDEIIEAIYLANGKEIPNNKNIQKSESEIEEKSEQPKAKTKKLGLFARGKQKLGSIKENISKNKSRKIIQKYDMVERLNMSEDKILEIYSYEDLKKYKIALERAEMVNKPKKEKESKIKQLPSKVKANLSKAAAAGKQKLESEIEEKSEQPKAKTKKLGLFARGKQKLGSIKENISEKNIRHKINKYNLPELLDSTEDEIYEIFTPEEITDYISDQRKEKLNKMKEKLKSGFKKFGTGSINVAKTVGKTIGKVAKGAFGVAGNIVKGGAKLTAGLARGAISGLTSIAYGIAEKISSKDIENMSYEDIIKTYRLEDDLNASTEEIMNTFTKEEIIDYIRSENKEKANAKKESLLQKIGKGIGNGIGAIGSFGIKTVSSGLKLAGGLMRGGVNLASKAVGGVKNLFGKGDSEFRSTLLAKLDKIDNDILGKPTNGIESFGVATTSSESEEGSYTDQKSDKEKKENKETVGSIQKNIAAIAATLGTTQSIAATGKESVQPENNIASLLKANYENAEKQNDLLENINENSAKAAKNAGGGKWSGLGTFGGKLAKGITAVGNVATIGAAGAGAIMLGKQVKNKVKTMKQDTEHSTKIEKFGSLFGAGGAGNYDAEGNEIDNSGKAGRSFGVNQLVHVGTFAKGVSKIGGLFGKFSGFVSKIFSNPKIIAKIGGKEAAANVSKAFLKEMGKATAKPGILAKISGKISSFCAKVSQPIGWGVMIAQLVYDIGTGMAEANRYFSMGKGMKPTFAMRITAGLAKALSGNLTFGLIPPATIANFVFNIIGKDSTKKQMEEAKEFDTKRAAIMEVEYKRLVEFETMTWSEILFGQDKKRATILGFLKFDKKHPEKNKDSIAKFKNWFEKVYKPLDQMYKDMAKQYGGKVDKKIDPEDIAAMENRDKFRKDYLDAAKKYMSSNKLYGLGPLGKSNLNPAENKLLKEEEKQKEDSVEKEEEQMQKTSEDSSAELSAEGLDVKNVSNTSPSLTAKLPDTKSDNISESEQKIKLIEPKEISVTNTTGNATVSTQETKNQTKAVLTSRDNTKNKLNVERIKGKEDLYARNRKRSLNNNEPIVMNGQFPTKYVFDKEKNIWIPDISILESSGADESKIEKYLNNRDYYDKDGYIVDKNTLQRRSSKEAENAQADGINFKKIMNKNYISQWKQYAKDNIQKTRLFTAAQNARAGIIGSLKKTKVGAAISAGFKKVKNLASSLIGGAKDKISSAKQKLGALFSNIKSPADAIASFVTRRKESEAELSSMFNDKNDQTVLNLADKIKDSRAIGQQRSSANLSPEFAQRVEAFLKDPRVMNHGVTIREGYRSPLTQLAYFSKGRADNSITDKLMKKAGFKDGINFWAKSFQKPGDYITWTLASNHFNGTAVDLEPGDLGYDKLGSIAAEYGIDWGGNWSTPDKPHFEMGDPSFKLNKAVASSSTSVGEAQQADTINYDRMLNYANKAKDRLSNTVGYLTKDSKNGILSHLNGKKLITTTTSKLAYKAKDVYNKAKSSMNASLNKDESIINSNLIVSKFDDLLKLSSEGVDIMRNLYDETMRHNKKEEEMLGNLIKGIAGLGALMAAAQNGGYSSAGSSNSITKGIFDSLAKGI